MLVFHTPNLVDQLVPYSYRARATVPSSHIENSRVTHDLSTIEKGDVVVLGKKHQLQDAVHLKENNIKFIVDIADHKFTVPEFKHWYATIPMASAITTTCEFLAMTIRKETGVKNIHVIPDPTERKRKDPDFQVKDIMTMCWYGADKNFEKVDWGLVQTELSKVYPTQFMFMSNPIKPKRPHKRIKSHHYWLRDMSIKDRHLSAFDNVIEWSFEGQERMVDEADIVLIPVTNDKEAKSKGNNRPIDALQRGKFVLSNPGINSYEILKDYIAIGNLCEEYKKAIDNPEKINDMIKKGQIEIDKNYTPYSIGNKWKKVYEAVNNNNME